MHFFIKKFVYVKKKQYLCTLFRVNMRKNAWIFKKAMGGCNVSHSKRHTKRTFDVNLFRRKFYWVEQDVWIELNVSAAGLRTINKIGLDNALKQAAEKGYLY